MISFLLRYFKKICFVFLLFSSVSPSYADDAAKEEGNFFENFFGGWEQIVHSGLEKYLGYTIQKGEVTSKQEIKALAESSCMDAEKALGKGRDTEVALKLNKCKILGTKIESSSTVVRSMVLLGELHSAQGHQNVALGDFHSAVLVAKQLKLPKYEVRALLGISLLNLLYGDYETAEISFKKIKNDVRELQANSIKDMSADTQAQILYTRIALGIQKSSSATIVSLLLPALEDLKPNLSQNGLLYYWHAKAWIAEASNKYDDAISFSEQGLDILKVMTNPADPFKGKIWSLKFLMAKGAALKNKGQTDKAVSVLEEARESFYLVRTEFLGDTRILKNISKLAGPVFGNLMALYNVAVDFKNGLKVAVDYKNLKFLNELETSTLFSNDDLEKQVKSVAKKMMAHFVMKGGLTKKPTLVEILPALDAGAAQTQSSAKNYLTKTDVVASLLPMATIEFDYDSFKNSIPDKTVLVEYVFVDHALQAYMLSKDKIQSVAFSKKVEDLKITPVIEKMRSILAVSDKASIKVIEKLGQELYGALLQPALGNLASSGTERVVLGTTRVLSAVPFMALHDGTKWLVEKVAVSQYSNLMHLWRYSRQEPKLSENAVITYSLQNEAREPASEEVTLGAAQVEKQTRSEFTKENIIDSFSSSKTPNVVFLENIRIKDNDIFSCPVAQRGTLKLHDFLTSAMRGPKILGFLNPYYEAYGTGAEEFLSRIAGSVEADRMILSFWQNSGKSKSKFLEKFFSETALGMKAADAIRSATLLVKADAAYSHPHHWASLSLWGGW